jgi:periplasmic divalent cation tolerance protein
MTSAETSVVLVTAPDRAVAERVVTALVEERLAACGNIVDGVTSIYRWHGALERADEVLIVLKTLRGLVPRLTERVVTLHPYDVPEVLALPVSAGLGAYMDWIAANANA